MASHQVFFFLTMKCVDEMPEVSDNSSIFSASFYTSMTTISLMIPLSDDTSFYSQGNCLVYNITWWI